MQALKLVRKIMEVNCGLLPRCIVHSLISIAENAEDNFSRVAVETICEISTLITKKNSLHSDTKPQNLCTLQWHQITNHIYFGSQSTRTSRKLIIGFNLFVK
jgi:uncharacterized 2Fe-2S/4Fe-4S cluster protein (DUF4445 family)